MAKGGKYQGNIFHNWKEELEKDDINERILIASIPFVRNLIEYIHGTNEDCYKLLTSLLHLRDDTKTMKLSDLIDIYKDIWNLDLNIETDYDMYNLIFEEAENIINDTSRNLKLENKIALSMAIRLLAEELMIAKIVDKTKITNINENQTRILFNEFKKEFEEDPLLKSLEKVNLMTPENIHLNSFMYEPILDITDRHLRELYIDIKNANDVRVQLDYEEVPITKEKS